MAQLPEHAKDKAIEIWFQTKPASVSKVHGPAVWAGRGTRPRAPRDQRHEWAYIFGAVCPQRRATAALVIDGAGYHVAARLAVPPNITLVRLPPYAPELNPVENVWEYLRGNKLAITVFESYDDIVDKSCAAWRFFADDHERVASITSRT